MRLIVLPHMTVIHQHPSPTDLEEKEYIRTVTSKGQVTIPAAIRRQLGVKAQGEVIFRMSGQMVEIAPAAVMSLEEAAGSVPPLRSGKTVEEAVKEAKEEKAEKLRSSHQP